MYGELETGSHINIETRPGEKLRQEIIILPQHVRYPVIVYGKRYGTVSEEEREIFIHDRNLLHATDFIILYASPEYSLNPEGSMATARRVLDKLDYKDFSSYGDRMPHYQEDVKSEIPAIVCKFRGEQGYFFELFHSTEGRHAEDIGVLSRTNRPFDQIRTTFFPTTDVSRMYSHFAAFYPSLYTGKIHPEWVSRAQRPKGTPTRLPMHQSRPLDPTLDITLPRIGKIYASRNTSLIRTNHTLLVAKLSAALQTDRNVIVECVSSQGTYLKLLVAQTLAYLESSNNHPFKGDPFDWSTAPIVDGIKRGLIFRKPDEDLPSSLKLTISNGNRRHTVIHENELGALSSKEAEIVQRLYLFQKYSYSVAHQRFMLGML